jgi:hypothetical protein
MYNLNIVNIVVDLQKKVLRIHPVTYEGKHKMHIICLQLTCNISLYQDLLYIFTLLQREVFPKDTVITLKNWQSQDINVYHMVIRD